MKIELCEPFRSKWKNGYLRLGQENRKLVDLVNTNSDRTTIAYSRYLMSIKIGDFIPDGYEVDHIDNNKTNDNISNLQIVTSEYNKLKKEYHYVMFEQIHYGVCCANCGIAFLISRQHMSAKLASNTELAFCSRQCAGKYHTLVSYRSNSKK